MRFKSSVLKTIKVCQNSQIRNPKRAPELWPCHARHIKHDTPRDTNKRPNKRAACHKNDGHEKSQRANQIIKCTFHCFTYKNLLNLFYPYIFLERREAVA